MKWPLIPIGEFSRTSSGGTPLREQQDRYYGGSIPWVKSGELREGIINKTEESITQEALDESAAKIVPAGAVLIAMYGATVGRVGILGIDAATNQAICSIVHDRARVDTRYLFHALQAEVPTLLARRVGGAQPNISQEIVRTTKIPLPEIEEQRRIAAILDQAEALRAKRREALAKLDTLTQSLFLEMFGDPATNPHRWPVFTIGQLVDSANYGSSIKANAHGKYPMLRMNNITMDGRIDITELKYVDLPLRQEDRWLVRDGEILFNRTNSAELVGKTAVYRLSPPMAFAGYLIRLRVNTKAVPEYISAFLNSRYGKATLKGMCKSIIGMANINAKEVQAIRIPVPPVKLQQKFERVVLALEPKRSQMILNSERFHQMFASLQHRAFRGEL